MMSLRIARQWSVVTMLVVLAVLSSAAFLTGPRVAVWLARHDVAPSVAYPSDILDFDESESMMCWIDKAHQLHCKSKTYLPTASVPSDGVRWTSLVVHQRGACALDDFVMRCWGDAPKIPNVLDDIRLRHLFVWNNRFCALKNNSPVCWSKTQRAWSPLPKGQMYGLVVTGGDRMCGLARYEDLVFCVEGHHATKIVPTNLPVQHLALGRAHVCALTKHDSKVRCWGSSWFGKRDVPDKSFTAILASDEATCGLTRANEVHCWGKDMHGKVDVDTRNDWRIDVVGDRFCRFGAGPTVCWPH